MNRSRPSIIIDVKATSNFLSTFEIEESVHQNFEVFDTNWRQSPTARMTTDKNSVSVDICVRHRDKWRR